MMLKEKLLLKDRPSSAIVAARDLDRARAFYADTLGLEPTTAGSEEGVLTFRTGSTQLIVYESEFAGSNKANAVVWNAGEDFEVIADQLREQGVTILFVEHLMRAVLELSDRIVVLNEGEVIATGRPREAMRDPRVIDVYLGRGHAA